MKRKYEQVFKVAVQVFENDIKRAERWLNTPLSPLGGKTPKEVLDTKNGEQSILQLLERIEHTVYM